MFARMTALVLAGVLGLVPVAMARTHDEIQAPRGQEIQAPRGQEIQAPRDGHGPDVPMLRR